MRISGPGGPLKFNATGCIVLPLALFLALMLATAGAAAWPKMAAPGAMLLCGGGELVYESQGASYRPGEYVITRQIHCQTGTGKQAARDDITLAAMGVSFLIYAVVLFLLFQFVARPLVAGRLRRRMESLGFGGTGQRQGWPGTPAAGRSLGDLLAQVQEAVQRGDADVQVRDDSVEPGNAEADGGDAEARLTQLKALRDRGLITAADYETKKAEILAGL